jgi:hypothetical protein
MGAQQFPHFFYPASQRSHCQIGKGAAGHLCSREEMIQQKGSTLRFAFEATSVGGWPRTRKVRAILRQPRKMRAHGYTNQKLYTLILNFGH